MVGEINPKLPTRTLNNLIITSSQVSGLVGGGTVTSVTYTGDGVVHSNTPSSAVTSSGTLIATLNNQNANVFLSGPSSGSATTPTFRTIIPKDLPIADIYNYTFSGGL